MEKDTIFLDGETQYLNISTLTTIIYKFKAIQIKTLQDFLKEPDKET